MATGKQYLVYISSDGTALGTKTEVEFQGDLTINEGKTINRFQYKNGTLSAHALDGFSATFQMGIQHPLGTGQQLIATAHDNEATAYIWIETTETGGWSYEGPMKVVLNEISANRDDPVDVPVELSEDGVVTKSTVA